MKEQRGLIDALTAESMSLREEAAALQVGGGAARSMTLCVIQDPTFWCIWSQASLQQQSTELEQKLDMVVLAMGGLAQPDTHVEPHQGSDVRITGSLATSVSVFSLQSGYV